MPKKYIIFFLLIVCITQVTAAPEINCGHLPGCNNGTGLSERATFNILWRVIETAIQYTAVIAVIAIMIGGIMYLLSSGDEEKTKKAQKVIVWSLVWVIVSISAYGLINIINHFQI